MHYNPHYSELYSEYAELVIWKLDFVFLSVMMSSKSSYNNLYRISTSLDCLIKLVCPTRSNTNNTTFAVALCKKHTHTHRERFHTPLLYIDIKKTLQNNLDQNKSKHIPQPQINNISKINSPSITTQIILLKHHCNSKDSKSFIS